MGSTYLTTASYMTTSSESCLTALAAPYLAGRCIQQLVIDEGHKYPLAIELFKKGSYVDDISGGADDLATLNAIGTQVDAMSYEGCFPLAEWKSNHPHFFALKSSDITNDISHQFNDSPSKILGFAWQSVSDLLIFSAHTSHNSVITKHTILSETAQLFDPLGLISPVVVRAKILMQDLWLETVGWDDTLTPQLINRWKPFREELSGLSSITIPRWLHTTSERSHIEIHGFSDASHAAMAAVGYIKVSFPHQPAQVTLACSKTRVAPLQRHTIPRLELSVTLLLTKLVSCVQATLDLSEVPVTLWSDSSVTLACINSKPSRWKEFVKNRVQAIHQTAPEAIRKLLGNQTQLIAHHVAYPPRNFVLTRTSGPYRTGSANLLTNGHLSPPLKRIPRT